MRRAVRVAVAAGLVTVLAAAGPVPFAFAADNSTGPVLDVDDTSAPALKSAHDKLGSVDAGLLAEAEADGDRTVTMMIATAPGQTEQVVKQLDAVKGGSVGRTYDKLGYVRATVPTGRAGSAIAAAVKLSSVHGIDLRDEISLDEPLPGSDTAKGAALKATAVPSETADTYPGPDKNTPAVNPYNPSFETGAVDFVKKHPTADGRGVTIGVVDTGVDLGHPALQTTTTGERKIADWVTATDPIIDGDGTWRAMNTSVTGTDFTYDGQSWKAPSGSDTYRINLFRESVTAGGKVEDGEPDGDANRDGDTTDAWGVLYDATTGTVTVDVNDNGDFADDEPMKPYKDGHQIGWFGTDNPATAISERQPFVVEIRKDVPMDPYGGDWVGKTSDFVNIGVVNESHGTHVAGITAANGLFGGKMNGAAPGAKIVSSRACIFGGGCTNIGLTEGMIDVVVNRGVDIVSMSIGGLPAVNDGNNARSELYTRLIDQYGVQLVIAAGNSGPGANTIEDPGLADKVISVGAGVSKETWAADYGSVVEKKYGLFTFSSRGPREDGGFAPTLVAPGAAVSSLPSWMPGDQFYSEYTGWTLPPGYGMYNGTSMATPQASGASALLLSAAKQQGIDLTPAKLRTALTSTAGHIKDLQAYEEGAGRIDIMAAWKQIAEGAALHSAEPAQYTVKAPVDTALDPYLKTPGFGTGLHDREGGLKAGEKKTYDVTITRTTGPATPVPHTLRLKNNTSDTFSIVGPTTVLLPLNQPVTVKVLAAPTAVGIKSARLEVDDPTTVGIDRQIMTTVVVSTPVAAPGGYTFSASDSVQRNSAKSYFVTVPEGATSMEVALDGLKDGSWTVASAVHPYGIQTKDDDPKTSDVAAYPRPKAGVWEIVVQSYYATEMLDNPYNLHVKVYGTTFDPEPVTVPEVKAGTQAAVSWTATNTYAALDGTFSGGSLASAQTAHPTIADQETQSYTVVVPEGATTLDAAISGIDDFTVDLDLMVYDADGNLVDQSADGDSDESVSIPDPAAGTYTVEVFAFDVPAGSVAYDYRDAFSSSALGTVTPADQDPVKLGSGDTRTVSATVTAKENVAEGRELLGEVRLVNALGTAAGVATVKITKVTP
ncbi:S8 family serine peptidase [Streptomyces sp. NPDC020898]|uniref:S8 family serine peptidase n=1 Tax=Streptomyces sp. NPDC020898 TaxID=3365101 RepID=UPI00378D4139